MSNYQSSLSGDFAMSNGHESHKTSTVVDMPKTNLPFVDTMQTNNTSKKSSENSDNNGDENEERGNWGNKMDFILSSVGFAVGLGNVWRFPYLCYKNGGGAFLVPYVIMLFAAGLPMFVIELGFGQFVSKGCVGVWDLAPLFKGLGWAMVIISGMVVIYYNMIIAYIFFYFFASFNKVVPWSTCGNEWNTEFCEVSTKSNSTLIYNTSESNATVTTVTRPAEEFWLNYALGRSEGLHDMGTIRWQLLLCLLLAWIVVFLCLIKGIKSVGKVVYFTATFPYIVLFILLIRGLTLPGAMNGIYFYIVPRFDQLGNPTVWKDAAVQVFYSLGPAWGSLHTLASYNKFHNNFHRDGITVGLINCGTSVFAGFVIFAVIGFMSHDSGMPIEDVAAGGSGLAFVAYPEAIARMPGAVFWALLFFFMLLTLGLDSMFCNLETVVTAIVDELKPVYPNIYQKKTYVTGICCVVFFILGLPMTTNGGFYMLTLMDEYSAGFSIILISMGETLVISYVYGIENFMRDMMVMLKFKMNIYWKICWMAISPSVMFFVFIFFGVGYKGLTLDGYRYPPWAEFLGWGMTIAAALPVPAYMIYFLNFKAYGNTWKERFFYSLKPADSWGPALNKHRAEANYPLIADESKAGIASNGFNKLSTVDEQWQPPPKMMSNGTPCPGYAALANGDYEMRNGDYNNINDSYHKKEPVVSEHDSVTLSRDMPLSCNSESSI
ncbi:sodium- and chloride-dependent glycine transporter 1-like [Amphiura filiformis]|uniref:sodium- and chloride-dependent glycine transporter 1-like n=1 Tax=Amphiura filiformis TaxID=82378 RepID=UPI003B224DE5